MCPNIHRYRFTSPGRLVADRSSRLNYLYRTEPGRSAASAAVRESPPLSSRPTRDTSVPAAPASDSPPAAPPAVFSLPQTRPPQIPPPSAQGPQHPFSELIDRFLIRLEAAGFARSSLGKYRVDLMQATEYFGKMAPELLHLPHTLSRFHIEQYKAHLEQRYAPTTAFNRFSAFRRFVEYLVHEGICKENFALTLSGPRPERVRPHRPLSVTGVRALLAATSSAARNGMPATLRDHALVRVLLYAGLRAQELCGLRWEDVHFHPGLLVVQHGKGGHRRAVPFDERVGDALLAWQGVQRPRTEHVFTGRFGEPLAYHEAARILVRLARRARLGRKLSAHALRHTCATQLLRSGLPIEEIQRLLGHQWLTTTQIYTQVDVETLREVVEAADPLGFLDKGRAEEEKAQSNEVSSGQAKVDGTSSPPAVTHHPSKDWKGRWEPYGDSRIVEAIEAWMERFRVALWADGLGEVTISAHLRRLRQLGRFLGKQPGAPDRPEALTSAHLEAFLIHARRDQKNTPWELTAKIRTFRRFFDMLIETSAAAHNPAQRLFRAPEPRPGYRASLSVNEVIALERAASTGPHPERNRALLLLFLSFGLRTGDLTGLRVEAWERAERILEAPGPNGHRKLPVTDRLSQALESWLAVRQVGSPWLFPGSKGAPLSHTLVRQAVYQLGLRAGLSVRVTPQLLRNTCFSLHLAAGVDLRYVQELLGHVELTSTAEQGRWEPEQLRQALAAVDPYEELGES